MITIQTFTQAIDFKITDGSAYGWGCFGPNARWLDTEDLEYTAAIVFDSVTQIVYLAEVSDYVNNRSYRLVNPEYATIYLEESTKRGIDHNQAWDNVSYIDLDVNEDWLEKCTAIVNKQFDYDTRVIMTVDFNDTELLRYMMAAHKLDITFNEFITQALSNAISLVKLDKVDTE